MSNPILEILRAELDDMQTTHDMCMLLLSHIDEEHKELTPDHEFDALFALKRAEIDYLSSEVEVKIERLKNEIKRLESQD